MAGRPRDVKAAGRLVRIPTDPGFNEAAPPFMSATADEGFAFSSMGDPRLRVIIVGTGFAGLSAAIACARQQFNVTVLERSSGLSPHGDSIIFGSNASVLLHRWGVGEEMAARSSMGGWWLLKDQAGTPLLDEEIGVFSKTFGAPLLQGRRAQFLGSLGTEARLLGVNIKLEAEVTSYWDSDDQPAVVLRTGEVIRGDVIIVADGIQSVSRRLLASQGRPAAPARPSGYSIHRAAIPSAALQADPRCNLLDGNIRTWLGPDAHAAIYPMDSGHQVAFVRALLVERPAPRTDSPSSQTFTHADPADVASTDWRAKHKIDDILSHFEGWDPTLQAALGHFSSCLNWKIFDETPAADWINLLHRRLAPRALGAASRSFRCSALLPRARATRAPAQPSLTWLSPGSAPPRRHRQPTSFQGGSQAVEDGATVALCLALAGGDTRGVPLALETYEALRRPRVHEAQGIGRTQRDLWHAYTSLAASSPSKPPAMLRPLTFRLYGFDAERYALRHFEACARAIERGFELDERAREEAARRAGLDLDKAAGGSSGRRGVGCAGNKEHTAV
ncbi:SPOSA6832_02475 [Sporobolomyces salmonicolor]|uniref:SPOSA6832_02475-mRNA-1:cds n=1 Tax=Sporidiobolus salmonicolor TaxID=5005 RepID=A0A0D6ELE3_SPOSA|nr:SPOSA6832_02475 [Sporobolomyces salmonicolor]